jgi:hypothetical protein
LSKKKLIQECPYDPPHVHKFPKNWIFGGPAGTDPRADPRWTPDSYQYFDGGLRLLHTTTVPFCDDEALDAFTAVASFGPGYHPRYIGVVRAGTRKLTLLPFEYDEEEDLVTDRA